MKVPVKNLPRMQLTLGEHTLSAYVARGEAERALGLMHCAELGDDEAMLFVSGEASVQSFWMKDTPLPLSAAFIADDGTILQIAHMEPDCEESHGCETPVRHVLEVKQGWFEAHGVRRGMRVCGPPFLA
jgi:uncharacterized membrane protein (UPF0127 family)